MRHTIRMGYGFQIGRCLWTLVTLAGSVVLLSALGHVLMGRYLLASFYVAGVVGLYGMVGWLLRGGDSWTRR